MSEIKSHDAKIYFQVMKKAKKNSEPTLKFSSTLLCLLIFVFLSFDVFGATCEQLFYTETGSESVRPYKAYYTDTQYTPENCPHSIVMTKEEFFKYDFYAKQFGEVDPISAIDIAESFTWGFGVYIGFWFLSYTIRTAKGVIKEI